MYDMVKSADTVNADRKADDLWLIIFFHFCGCAEKKRAYCVRNLLKSVSAGSVQSV